MDKITAIIKPYAWGSRTALASRFGFDSSPTRLIAEIWYGAHPSDPSLIRSRAKLDEVIYSDPIGCLGSESVKRFGPRLPFLLKILSAAQPLSLQVHPSSTQAADGFLRENLASIPLAAPNRSYRDENHKPEMLVALETFEANVGFRPVAETLGILDAFGLLGLNSFRNKLAQHPNADGLRFVVSQFLTLSRAEIEPLVCELVEQCSKWLMNNGNEHKWSKVAITSAQLGELYPKDPGVLVSILLNRLTLEPGESIHLPAGVLHSYLSGVGVEIMANSDNVLRGGLTPKHVNVPELLRVLNYDPIIDSAIRSHPSPHAPVGIERYPKMAPEFQLSRIRPTLSQLTLDSVGPRVLLCTAGVASCTSMSGESIILQPGDAVWLAHKDGPVLVDRVADDAELYLAGLP